MTDTTDPRLRSFIPVSPESHFPIQNLPFGVFRRRRGAAPRVGAAIGEEILDLSVLDREGLLAFPSRADKSGSLFDRPSLNPLMACGRRVWSELRERLSLLLRHDEPRLRDDAALRPDKSRRRPGAGVWSQQVGRFRARNGPVHRPAEHFGRSDSH